MAAVCDRCDRCDGSVRNSDSLTFSPDTENVQTIKKWFEIRNRRYEKQPMKDENRAEGRQRDTDERPADLSHPSHPSLVTINCP